jgi:type IV pilus assembly protein PilX
MQHLTSTNRQHGISLPTVLVLLLLSIISVLGAFRVGFLNEIMTGNVSDYNRTRAAAEAMMRDAEMDIRGRRPPYDVTKPDGTIGYPCRPDPANSTTSLVVLTGYDGCRFKDSGVNPWFPRTSAEFDAVTDLVVSLNATSRCFQAICMPTDITSLASIENNLTAMIPFGATYGQYTRVGSTATGVSGNTQLSGTGANARAWYWIEGFRFSQAGLPTAVTPGKFKDGTALIYRITAVAQGLKSGTQVVIKSIFVPFPAAEDIGQ